MRRTSFLIRLTAAGIGAMVLAIGSAARPAEQTASTPWQAYSLKEKFTAPGSDCGGWGKWQTPFVLANGHDRPATFLNGLITVPPRSVAVHPAPDRDAAVGWRSPMAGKVRLSATVNHAHPAGGDGITWAVLQANGKRPKVLAHGTVARGGSAVVPGAADAGELAAIAVAPGDLLLLAIGPGNSHHCDSTVVRLTLTEIGGTGRVWDLAGDVAADIQAGSPHADSLGNAAVWHFLALPLVAVMPEESLTTPRPKAGQRIEAWTVATEDTKLTVGATADGQLCIYELSSPAATWNWTSEPSVFPLVAKAILADSPRDLAWKYKDGTLDASDGQKLTVRFVCEQPVMELTSVWWARPGCGPVRHSMVVANRSSEPVTIFEHPTLHLNLAGPTGGELTMWSFHSDGGTPDSIGVYRDTVHPPFYRRLRTQPGGEFIPYAVFDAGGKQGVYVGIEWSHCRIAAAALEGDPAGTLRVRGGEYDGFRISLGPGEMFAAPPGFVGAYQGDVDDAGNRLRRYLFRYSIPEVVRKDPGYPKVQWNAFGAAGDKPKSWNSVERKYYPLIDDIAPLGFEEVMLDVGWWKGGTSASEPEADPVDWPSGMAKAAGYAHQKAMRFGLYWNKGEDMATAEGRERRMAHVKRLYDEYAADMWRSDNTGGPVVGASYTSVKGFYAMLDQLGREIPNFQWENCCSGGRIKDFGASQRCVKIFITDTYAPHHVRQAFYDSSFAFPPAQLMGCLGSTDGRYRPQGPTGMRFAFRTMSMGAPEWFIDASNGGNGSAPWTEEEKAAVKAAVDTYKSRIRPLVRNADLYHILPRPDNKNWDGIQYYDPRTKTGVVYLFKPAEGIDTMNIRLRGVQSGTRYRVTFEDGSNPMVERTGAELAEGLDVRLKGAPVSELVFLEGVR